MMVATTLRQFVSALLVAGLSLTLFAQTSPEPWFTQQPALQTVSSGHTATFTCNATGAPEITYQWMKNGVAIDGATEKQLVIEDVQQEDQGGYSVSITAGPYTYTSNVAPLVIVEGTGWQWVTRIGGTENDSALGLALGLNGLWVGAEYNGQVVRRYSKSKGQLLNDYPITSNGDGVSSVSLDGAGNLLLGATLEIPTPVYSRPGLLQKRKLDGTLTWSRAFGTEKGGTDTPNGYAEGLAAIPDGAGNVIVAGYYQGRGKFGTLYGGVPGETAMRGFVAKYDASGNAVWLRDMKSEEDADDCFVRDAVVDGLGDIYVSGSLGLNGRIQRSATPSDRTTLGNTYRRPFVAKYNSAGTLLWTYIPDELGEFRSVEVDVVGNVWTTGYIGSDEDITSRSGMLTKLNRISGAVVQTVDVDDVTGCVIRCEGMNAFWLAMDASGESVINGVQWGTTGYRCISLGSLNIDLDNIAWEVPVFGGLGARSDEADARIGADGSVSVALNFTSSDFRNSVSFPRRANFSLVGRGRDGIIAQIGELPVVTSGPASLLVAKGSETHIDITTGGELASTVQWFKGTSAMPEEKEKELWFDSIQLTDAGSYKARVTKGASSVDSDMSEIGVVDPVLKSITLPHHQKLTLTVGAAGNGLSFIWLKGGNPLNSDIRVTGVNTRTLVINDLVPPDAGAYSCRVTGPGGTLTTNAANVTVVLQPVVSDFNFDPGMTSAAYDFLPPVLNAATRYSIIGLPPGMTYNPTTGRITGRPTVSGTYRITITATNLAGTSTRTKLLTVAALPAGVVGKHLGSVAVTQASDTAFGLGGKWSANILPNGMVTGSVCIGAEMLPFSGPITINSATPYQPRLSFTLNRAAGRAPITLLIQLAENNTSTGTLAEQGGSNTTTTGWRQRLAGTGVAGLYNLGILPSTQPGTPRGHGYASFTVVTDGSLTVIGRLADDTPFTSAGFVGPNGEVLVWQNLQPSKLGVITGVLDITEHAASNYTGNTVAGTLHWARAALVNSRFAPAGFSAVPCIVDGGRYAHRTGPVMGLPATANNAKLRTTEGGLPSAREQAFTITPANKCVVPPPNASQVVVNVTPATGAFTASYVLSDPDPYLPGSMLKRTVAIKGLIRRDAAGQLRGCGFFILAQLPDAMANPPTTINTSPMLSGTAELLP